MQKYDVVVVGAGNGGLAAAACLAKAGKRVLLRVRVRAARALPDG